MWETWVQSLGQKDPLEKEMAIYSSTLAWNIPWMEEPTVGYSSWGHKESDMTEQLYLLTHLLYIHCQKCYCHSNQNYGKILISGIHKQRGQIKSKKTP